MTSARPRSLADTVELLRAHTDNGCFACGLENPIGLHIDRFAFDGDVDVTAVFTARSDLVGTVGVLHGGVAATALDEILVWAGIFREEVLTVTATLDLRYRRPLGSSGQVRLRGRVDDRSGRRLRLSGEIETDHGPAVTARGTYLVSMPLDAMLAHD